MQACMTVNGADVVVRVVVAEVEGQQTRMPTDAGKQQYQQLQTRHHRRDVDMQGTERHLRGQHRDENDDDDGDDDDDIEVLVGGNNRRAVVAMASVVSRGSSSRKRCRVIIGPAARAALHNGSGNGNEKHSRSRREGVHSDEEDEDGDTVRCFNFARLRQCWGRNRGGASRTERPTTSGSAQQMVIAPAELCALATAVKSRLVDDFRLEVVLD